MKPRQIIHRIISILLIGIVFVSSTGFVSVQHFCNMTAKRMVASEVCCCSEGCESTDIPVIEQSPCCTVTSNYFINAIASFDLKTVQNYFVLPLVKLYTPAILLFSNSITETTILSFHKQPPKNQARDLLLLKSLLLI